MPIFSPHTNPIMDINLIVAAIQAAAPHLHFEMTRTTADGVAFHAARRLNQAEPPTQQLAQHLRHILTQHTRYTVSTSLAHGNLDLIVVWPAAQPLKNWQQYLTPQGYGAQRTALAA